MSERKNTIIMINMNDHSDAKVYGSLKKACDDNEGWVYNTLVQKQMPFQQGKYIVNRVVFN